MHRNLIAALVLLCASLAAALPAVVTDDSTSITNSKTAASQSPVDSSTTSNSPSVTTSSEVSQPSVGVKLSTKHKWPSMEDPQLFEGDLKISQEMIDKYYVTESKENSTQVAL